MNAYEIPNLRFSLPAGEKVLRRRFVNVDANGAGVVATAAGNAIGVSMNEADDGEVLEIADGIVIVEAGGVIAAGADIEVGAAGKAVTNTAGIAVGIALTGAAGAGNFIAVKVVNAATNGVDGASLLTLLYTGADGAADADLADVPIGVTPGKGTIISVDVISLGAAAGIDADNTSVFLLEVGAKAKATATFDDVTAFPASGAKAALTIGDADVAEGDILSISVTNGATADLPGFLVQVVVALD